MKRITLLVITSLILLSCSGVVSEIKAKVLKYRMKKKLIELCEDNEKCKKAVIMKFDFCWNDERVKRMYDSNEEEKERQMSEFFDDLFDCLVDEHGKSYFKNSQTKF